MRRVVRTVSGLLLLLASGASAQQQLTRHSIDGGGGRSSSARYMIHGTVGQPDAVALLAGGPYRLGGGFWAGVDPGIFRDGFEDD